VFIRMGYFLVNMTTTLLIGGKLRVVMIIISLSLSNSTVTFSSSSSSSCLAIRARFFAWYVCARGSNGLSILVRGEVLFFFVRFVCECACVGGVFDALRAALIRTFSRVCKCA